MPTHDLSVVIVSFNTRPLLERCLAALPAAAGELSVQTIVVDNGSSDGSMEMVRTRYPGVELIGGHGNVGFARATNLGIARATGRVRVWLNSDAIPSPGALAILARHLDTHPTAGIAAPRLQYPDGRLQPSAQRFPGATRMLFHFLGARTVVRSQVVRALLRRLLPPGSARGYIEAHAPGDRVRSVDWVSGACLATTAHVAERIGPLDEAYFMYCEDTDWCHRVHDAGYEVHYVPRARVEHHVGGSRASNPDVAYQHYWSLLRYYAVYLPQRHLVVRWIMGTGAFACGAFASVGRLFGRPPHPWWRVVRLCLSPPPATRPA